MTSDMSSESPLHLSPNGNNQPPASSPSFSQHSAVSPRLSNNSSSLLTPPISGHSTPRLSGRSLSIKRKPVPTYLGDESIAGGRTAQVRNGPTIYTLSVDQPVTDVEVLQSPVSSEFDPVGDDRMSDHSTPSISGFAKPSPHLVRSTSAKSSRSLPMHQRKRPESPFAPGEMSLTSVRPNGGVDGTVTEGHVASLAAEVDRRPSQVSMSSFSSSVNSDFLPHNGSRPPHAAQSIVLGRPVHSSDHGAADSVSTQQLFTSFPGTQPNARIQQLRAARLQTAADGDMDRMQAPAMVRIPTDKSVDKQLTALSISGRDDTEDSGTALTGLGIRGAELSPILNPETSGSQQTVSRPASDNSEILRPIDTRLNHSLPSLPLGATLSNISAPAMRREKGLFRRKYVKPGDEFSEHAVPTPMRLWEASQCQVVDESGRSRRFGDFWDRYSLTEKGEEDNSVKSKSDRHSVKSLTRGVDGAHRHARNGHPDGASISQQSLGSLGRRGASGKNGSQRQGDKAEVQIGGEEYIIYGRRTVVFWIRHFWCGQCQDFTLASVGLLDAEAIHKAGLNVIVISNGSWKIIRRYRELFRCPFPIYVDASRRLYQLMGMTKLSNDFGPMKNRAAYHQHAIPRQVVGAIGNALFKMPLANPGTLTQLGGEFILGPGLKCDFAHRMTNTSNHLEAFAVLRQAGVDACMKTDVRQAEISQSEFEEIARLQQEEAQWRESRQEELAEIKKRKDRRRGVLSDSLDEGEKEDRGVDDLTGHEEHALDPEDRRKHFEEYMHRTGLTVNVEEDFDGFIMRDSDFVQKRLSTPMEREEEEAEKSAFS